MLPYIQDYVSYLVDTNVSYHANAFTPLLLGHQYAVY